MQIRFTSELGSQFTIIGTTNLDLPLSDWTVFGSAIETSPGNFEFIDNSSTNRSQGFYRVRSP